MEKNPNLIERFKDPNFKIARKGKWYAIAPLVIILAGLIVVLVVNFNLGLDFTGGRTVRFQVTDTSSANITAVENQVRNVMNDIRQENDAGAGWAFSIQQEYVTGLVFMTVQFQDVSGFSVVEMTTLHGVVINRLDNIPTVQGAYDAGTIAPSQVQDHLNRTFIAVTVALFAILIYMLFRFKVSSGVAALVGLIHDVLVMLALVAIFRIQVNATIMIVLITVIAYSLNNTLVLFDRIRGIEKMNDNKETTEQIVDRSVKETFTRTMNTTITTLVPIFVLIIFPVVPLREFALPILLGLIAGTFSTIFVTTSLYLRFENAKTAVRKRKKMQSAS